MDSDWKEAAKRLSELTINKNHRRIPSEVLYDILLAIKGNDERILENLYAWSNTLTSDGGLVSVGSAYRGGVDVSADRPVLRNDILGVVSLR